ncbi:unnamed protein product, partial [Meganyctiphanes norvegica]
SLVVVDHVSSREVDGVINFKHRDCRSRRGDVGTILPGLSDADPLLTQGMKAKSRQRRSLVFPSGSSLTFYNGLCIPVASDTYSSLGLYMAFPFSLDLPDAPIQIAEETPATTAAPVAYAAPPVAAPAPAASYGSYSAPAVAYSAAPPAPAPAPESSYGDYGTPRPSSIYDGNRWDQYYADYYNNNYYQNNNHSRISQHHQSAPVHHHTAHQPAKYPPGMSSYSYYTQDGSHYRGKRTVLPLDNQRMAAFQAVENGLETMGLPGRQCVLRAVCEVAEDPVDDLGLIGEVFNLIFSAGYGEGTDEMSEFIKAEELGRKEGGCESLYSDCPMQLVDLMQGGLRHLHSGIATAAMTNTV